VTRRRLAPGATLAAVAAACAWIWFEPDPITDAERPLLGTWRVTSGDHGAGLALTFAADHRYRGRTANPPRETDGVWWVRDGRLFVDNEPGRLRRIIRGVARRGDRPGRAGVRHADR
jgi:hypothetical protein